MASELWSEWNWICLASLKWENRKLSLLRIQKDLMILPNYSVHIEHIFVSSLVWVKKNCGYSSKIVNFELSNDWAFDYMTFHFFLNSVSDIVIVQRNYNCWLPMTIMILFLDFILTMCYSLSKKIAISILFV